MKEKCKDIIISKEKRHKNENNNDMNEIKENDEIDMGMLYMPQFDIGLLNYNTNTNPNPTPIATDTEVSINNYDINDKSIMEEVDFYILDLVHGYLRELS
eukprot:UN02217